MVEIAGNSNLFVPNGVVAVLFHAGSSLVDEKIRKYTINFKRLVKKTSGFSIPDFENIFDNVF